MAKAKAVLAISCGLTGSLFLVIGLLLYAFSHPIATFFSSDPQVLTTFDAVLPILPIFVFLDALQTVLEGGLHWPQSTDRSFSGQGDLDDFRASWRWLAPGLSVEAGPSWHLAEWACWNDAHFGPLRTHPLES